MGIKELWETLTPYCVEKPIYTLSGKVVAIDLACWVVCAKTAVTTTSSNAHATTVQHLSNVFFRTTQLLRLNVYPVFVLEGKAPVLKYDTIAIRNQQQRMFNGDVPIDNPKPSKDRTRFNFVLQKCADMLRCMGLVCVTAKGEAEAMCAYLNARKLVDGVISQDSDCFAYGARVVYRNFSITKNTCLVYDISEIETHLRFSRNKIVVLALFLGCDYAPAGVKGVARGPLLDYLKNYKDSEVIDRIRMWRLNKQFYEEYEMKLQKPHLYPMDAKLRDRMKNEITIRKKALKDPNFPNEDIIKEFLNDKESVDELDLKWKQPNLVAMIKFATDKMKWKEIYMFEKFLPLMTLWQLKNHEVMKKKLDDNKIRELRGFVTPQKIIKKQTLKGVASFQILWEDSHEFFNGLIPQEQLRDAKDTIWITSENAELFREAHPRLVECFEESLLKKKVDKKAPTNKRFKKQTVLPHGTIDAYFTVTANEKNVSFDLNCSGFSDGEDADLSLIVDRIVSRKPKLLVTAQQMGLKCATQTPMSTLASTSTSNLTSTPIKASTSIKASTPIRASTSTSKLDLIEMALKPNKNNCKSLGDSSDDDTIEYDPFELEILEEIERTDAENGENYCDLTNDSPNELNDTFDLDKPYVPLMERLKKTS